MWCTWTNLAPRPDDWWDFAYIDGVWVTWREVCRFDFSAVVTQTKASYASIFSIEYQYIYSYNTYQESYSQSKLTSRYSLPADGTQTTDVNAYLVRYIVLRTNPNHTSDAYLSLKTKQPLTSLVTQFNYIEASLKFYVSLESVSANVSYSLSNLSFITGLESMVTQEILSDSALSFDLFMGAQADQSTDGGSTYDYIDPTGTISSVDPGNVCAYVNLSDWETIPVGSFVKVAVDSYRVLSKDYSHPFYKLCFDQPTFFSIDSFDYSPSVVAASTITSSPPGSTTAEVFQTDWDSIDLRSDLTASGELYYVVGKSSGGGSFYLELNRTASLSSVPFEYRGPYSKLVVISSGQIQVTQNTSVSVDLDASSTFSGVCTHTTSQTSNLELDISGYLQSVITKTTYVTASLQAGTGEVFLAANLTQEFYTLTFLTTDGEGDILAEVPQETFVTAALQLLAEQIELLNSSTQETFCISMLSVSAEEVVLISNEVGIDYDIWCEPTEIDWWVEAGGFFPVLFYTKVTQNSYAVASFPTDIKYIEANVTQRTSSFAVLPTEQLGVEISQNMYVFAVLDEYSTEQLGSEISQNTYVFAVLNEDFVSMEVDATQNSWCSAKVNHEEVVETQVTQASWCEVYTVREGTPLNAICYQEKFVSADLLSPPSTLSSIVGQQSYTISSIRADGSLSAHIVQLSSPSVVLTHPSELITSVIIQKSYQNVVLLPFKDLSSSVSQEPYAISSISFDSDTSASVSQNTFASGTIWSDIGFASMCWQNKYTVSNLFAFSLASLSSNIVQTFFVSGELFDIPYMSSTVAQESYPVAGLSFHVDLTAKIDQESLIWYAGISDPVVLLGECANETTARSAIATSNFLRSVIYQEQYCLAHLTSSETITISANVTNLLYSFGRETSTIHLGASVGQYSSIEYAMINGHGNLRSKLYQFSNPIATIFLNSRVVAVIQQEVWTVSSLRLSKECLEGTLTQGSYTVSALTNKGTPLSAVAIQESFVIVTIHVPILSCNVVQATIVSAHLSMLSYKKSEVPQETSAVSRLIHLEDLISQVNQNSYCTGNLLTGAIIIDSITTQFSYTISTLVASTIGRVRCPTFEVIKSQEDFSIEILDDKFGMQGERQIELYSESSHLGIEIYTCYVQEGYSSNGEEVNKDLEIEVYYQEVSLEIEVYLESSFLYIEVIDDVHDLEVINYTE